MNDFFLPCPHLGRFSQHGLQVVPFCREILFERLNFVGQLNLVGNEGVLRLSQRLSLQEIKAIFKTDIKAMFQIEIKAMFQTEIKG